MYFTYLFSRSLSQSRIPKHEVEQAMTRNVIDILTIIPRKEILKKGIPYVRSIIQESNKAKWDLWWENYFKKYWMSSTAFIKTWNIHNKGKKYKDIQNRTNNGLERYNRHLNQKFPTPHPSLLIFVSALEEEARAQVQGLENIWYGKEIPNNLEEISVGPIPEYYKNFVL